MAIVVPVYIVPENAFTAGDLLRKKPSYCVSKRLRIGHSETCATESTHIAITILLMDWNKTSFSKSIGTLKIV